MGSWALHAGGLPVEELSRTHLQVLGLGCRPSEEKGDSDNPGSPPLGTVVDGQGKCWVLGERARHLDSTSRYQKKNVGIQDQRGRPLVLKATTKFRMSAVRPGVKDNPHVLLLPDSIEVLGCMDGPRAIGACGAAPGLPLESKNKDCFSIPSSPGASPRRAFGRRGSALNFTGHDMKSHIEPRITDAHDQVTQIRMHQRSSASEHLCLIVPCCRVRLGAGTHDEHPLVDAKEWPSFVSTVVLGGRVDAEIVSIGKVLDTKKRSDKNKANDMESNDGGSGNRRKWTTSFGDNLLLDFHSGPVSRGPTTARGTKVSDFLHYLDDHWVPKVRRFPATWSVLWIETLDTHMVSSELHGAIREHCPCCSTRLIFGSVPDKGEDTSSNASDEDEQLESLQKDASSSSISSQHSDESRKSSPLRLDAGHSTRSHRFKDDEIKRKEAACVVKRLLRDAETLTQSARYGSIDRRHSLVSDDIEQPPVATSPRSAVRASISRQVSMQSVGSRTNTVKSLNVDLGESIYGSEDPQSQPVLSRVASGSVSGAPQRSATTRQNGEKMIRAWETGMLPCSRCDNHGQRACHACICPKYDKHHFYFRALCAECCEAQEVVLESFFRRDVVKDDLQSEDEDEALTNESITHATVSRFNIPARPAFTIDMDVMCSDKQHCLAIEVELGLNLAGSVVHPARHQLLLDELRDEVHRALQIPLRQLLVLKDGASMRGTFQIAMLHPWLVPTEYQQRARRRLLARHRTKSVLDGPDVDLESQDAVCDLGLMWDRLITFLYGDTARHRKEISNAFPLLRCLRKDVAALQLRSAMVVTFATADDVVETLHWIKDHALDSSTLGNDSDVEEELQTSISEKDDTNTSFASSGRQHRRRTVTQADATRRKSQHAAQINSEHDMSLLTRPRAETSPIFDSRDSTPVPKDARQQNAQRVRKVPSSLRSPDLKNLLMTLPDAPSPNSARKLVPSWQKRAADQSWTNDARDIGLLPESSEVNDIHLPALHVLVWRDDFDSILSTLKQSSPATVNDVDWKGRTALHLATARCRPEVVRLFTIRREPKGPVKLDVFDVNGRVPLHYAAYRGNPAILSYFLQEPIHGSLDVVEAATGDSSVLIASRAMHDEALRALLQAKASAELANKRGLTPLHAAASAGATSCCQLLIEARSCVEALDALERTALDWAEIYQHTDIVQILQKHQPEFPLHRAFVGSSRPATTTKLEPPDKGDRPFIADGSANAHTRSLASICGIIPGRPNTEPSPGPRRRHLRTKGRAREEAASKSPVVQILDNSLRDSPLAGRQAPSAQSGIHEGWSGSAGSLALRWRSWAQGAFPESPLELSRSIRRGASKSHCHRGAISLSMENAVIPKPRKLPEVPIEPTRAQLADTAESMGAMFCTVCWEYVLEGHTH